MVAAHPVIIGFMYTTYHLLRRQRQGLDAASLLTSDAVARIALRDPPMRLSNDHGYPRTELRSRYDYCHVYLTAAYPRSLPLTFSFSLNLTQHSFPATQALSVQLLCAQTMVSATVEGYF